MRENGDASKDVIVKSDQENAFTGHLRGLIGDLVAKRGDAKSFVEEAAKGKVGDVKGGRGVLERSVSGDRRKV